MANKDKSISLVIEINIGLLLPLHVYKSGSVPSVHRELRLIVSCVFSRTSGLKSAAPVARASIKQPNHFTSNYSY